MLEKPDLTEETISACLQKKFGLLVAQISFLPLGADVHTAVYRAVTEDGRAYFVKLRRGPFDETSVTLPKFLSDQGIAQIIAPLTSKTGDLWVELDPFKLILYPFIAGCDGYEVNLSAGQWREFGGALRRMHEAVIPPALSGGIRHEAYSSRWRDSVMSFLARIDDDIIDDPVAQEAAAFLQSKRGALFYEGYGPTAIDQAALAYFRYERIIEDIAIYCAELLLGSEGGAGLLLAVGRDVHGIANA